MISIVSIDETELWDSIVKSFDHYDVYYLSQYAKAFYQIGEGEPLLFYYENNTTKAMNVVMKRDIAWCKPFRNLLPPNEMFDLSTPYGYGGFWIQGNDYSSLEKEYISLCVEKGYISEFVRFHLYSKYIDVFNGTIDSCTNNVVRSLNLDLGDMLKNFEHKVRKNINTARRSGLEIEIDETGKRLTEFLDIYYKTMIRRDAGEYYFFPEDFFKSIQKMHDNFVYIHVLYENKVISTELVLYGKENSYSFLGGTRSEYFHLRPNDFLKVEIMKWLKEKGIKRFILGGGYGEDDGIFKYKKSFAPNGIQKFYIGKRIFDQDKYDYLMEIRKKEQGFPFDTEFFPGYRGSK